MLRNWAEPTGKHSSEIARSLLGDRSGNAQRQSGVRSGAVRKLPGVCLQTARSQPEAWMLLA
eukprot:3193673-Alexandrium_andersonii.AAC.1